MFIIVTNINTSNFDKTNVIELTPNHIKLNDEGVIEIINRDDNTYRTRNLDGTVEWKQVSKV